MSNAIPQARDDGQPDSESPVRPVLSIEGTTARLTTELLREQHRQGRLKLALLEYLIAGVGLPL